MRGASPRNDQLSSAPRAVEHRAGLLRPGEGEHPDVGRDLTVDEQHGEAEVGERHLVGHSGAWPGHITLPLLDPVGKLVVSVLTNAVDGPAEDLVTGLVELVDVALEPR